jgi:hypothetical protein
MMRERIKIRVAELPRNVRATFSRLKQWRLSPLSAIVLAVLSAITTGTALFAAVALLWPVSADDGATAPDWNPPTLAVVELDPPKPASADTEALSRPIFAKSRKPSPKAAATVDSANISDTPTGLVVTAIVKNKKVAQAFVTSNETPEGGWRKVGDNVGSWKLNKILHSEVVFQSGDQLTRVKLYVTPSEGQGEAASGAGASQGAPPNAPPGAPAGLRAAPPD